MTPAEELREMSQYDVKKLANGENFLDQTHEELWSRMNWIHGPECRCKREK